MVQVFMVLRCFSCETFQVHQVKKSSNKWLCKICNEKQSVQKVYGQGTAADCRQHVQKLNMMRGEKETAEQQMLNHPPEEYAEAFDEDHHHCSEPTVEHPVLLAGKGSSKWKLYTEPQDSNSDEEEPDDAGMFTTDKTEFDKIQRKKRKDVKRCASDSSKPHPLSKTSRKHSPAGHTPSVSHSQTPIHPYSAVSEEMGHLLSSSKSSYYIHSSSDRYHKLDDVVTNSHPHSSHPHSSHPHSLHTTHSLLDTVDTPHTHRTPKSPASQQAPVPQALHRTQEDRIASIREDIGRFSKNTASSAAAANSVGVIPAVSSRWSKFMSEVEEEDVDEREREDQEEGSVQMHLLQGRVTVARYN